MKKRRICALVTALAVLFLIVCSFIFIAGLIPHECTGEDCIICCIIDTCRKKTDFFASFGKICGIIMPILYITALSLVLLFAVFQSDTPVKLKVKLSN